jgi:GNAT superfamily N-acetyltransferase
MDIEIKALTQELSGDYFRFFDGAAFSDHGEWAGCYCMFYHIDPAKEKEWDADGIGGRRAVAERWIKDGIIRGYLAYADGEVVGWCNAGDKTGYQRLAANKALWQAGDHARVKSVVCYLIAPEQRGKGIATRLLERVCRDAAAEGFSFVEAYPSDGELDSFKHYHGHPAMYEKAGFDVVQKCGGFAVMRKKTS